MVNGPGEPPRPELARRLCTTPELIEGGRGLRFEIQRDGLAQAAFVVRHHGKARAYVNRCAHVGVELDWNPGEFFDCSKLYLVCATHGALYAPESGRCVRGPCRGQALEALPVVERDGQVFLLEAGAA
jgi:nitrite reductase/ring-hydroxylating ferredoxin subunit